MYLCKLQQNGASVSQTLGPEMDEVYFDVWSHTSILYSRQMYLIPQNGDIMSIAIDIPSGPEQIIAHFLRSEHDESLSQCRELIYGSVFISPDFQLLPRVFGGELEGIADYGEAGWAW